MMDEGSLTLKVAFLMFRITGEGHLRFLLLQLVQYLPVGDIAHLIVLVHHNGLLVADTSQPFWHQSVACPIGLTYVAVDAFPSILTITGWALPG